MSVNRDDIRAAVAAGTITEAQAASILALSDSRRGARENIEGLDEPFELFKGFNEIFIVVGLSILFAGWMGISGVSIFLSNQVGNSAMLFALIGMGVCIFLARYFTLKRRMIAPSIALAVMFGLSTLQFSTGLGNMLSAETPIVWAITAAGTGALLLLFWIWFHVPFALFLVALSVFGTAFSLTLVGGATLSDARQMFILTGTGPLSLITIGLGIIGLIIALRFDMSDPHRVTRRAQNGFWLHIIAAPAIVNTVALTLFQSDRPIALLILLIFLTAMALLAIIIDRRSFLVSGIGYVVALAVTVVDGNAFYVILILGAGLVLLGAQWEVIRNTIMRTLPNFPGKDRLPPYAKETA